MTNEKNCESSDIERVFFTNKMLSNNKSTSITPIRAKKIFNYIELIKNQCMEVSSENFFIESDVKNYQDGDQVFIEKTIVSYDNIQTIAPLSF